MENEGMAPHFLIFILFSGFVGFTVTKDIACGSDYVESCMIPRAGLCIVWRMFVSEMESGLYPVASHYTDWAVMSVGFRCCGAETDLLKTVTNTRIMKLLVPFLYQYGITDWQWKEFNVGEWSFYNIWSCLHCLLLSLSSAAATYEKLCQNHRFHTH